MSLSLRGYKLQEAHSTDEGAWRRGFPLLLCTLYLLPAEPEEIIFQSSVHRTSSLMYSPLLSCVYVCPTLRPSPTLTFLPHPLLSFPPCLSISVLSVPTSALCISFSSPARLLRQILFHCRGHEGPIQDLLLTQTHTQ